MSTPKCALKRSPSSAGNASPAEETSRRLTSALAGSFGLASMPAKPVGAPKKTVGFAFPTPPSQRLNVASGVGRSAIKMLVAPTLIGKVKPFPRP